MKYKIMISVITVLIGGCSVEQSCNVKNIPIDDEEYIVMSNYCSSKGESSKFFVKNDVAYCSTNGVNFEVPRMKKGFTKTCALKY